MERKLFKVGNVLVNNGGTKVVVYEVTETFAFVAPYVQENGKLDILVDKTVVYSTDESKEVLEPISSISIADKSPEVVDVEPVAEPVGGEPVMEPVNEKVAAWTEDTFA